MPAQVQGKLALYAFEKRELHRLLSAHETDTNEPAILAQAQRRAMPPKLQSIP